MSNSLGPACALPVEEAGRCAWKGAVVVDPEAAGRLEADSEENALSGPAQAGSAVFRPSNLGGASLSLLLGKGILFT